MKHPTLGHSDSGAHRICTGGTSLGIPIHGGKPNKQGGHLMRLSRRDFLKMGCISIGTLASVSILGCSAEPSADTSNGSANSEVSNMEANTESAASSTDAAHLQTAGKPAVVYFSCTGNTEAVAEKIAAATDGALMRIEPAEPYTPADLDYNSDCRANTEQRSGDARPALAAPIPDISGYDMVFLGYPIWWGEAPRIILTFLEGANLAGKTIVPFCTSGSSPIDGSIAEIEQAAPGATVAHGRRFSPSVSQQEIDSWVNGL